MKYLYLLLLGLLGQPAIAQVKDTLHKKTRQGSDMVIFITTIDIANATKEGIYLNGYVVHLDYEQIQKWHGKKVKVSGVITIVRGVNNKPDAPAEQGRAVATKHLLTPKIELVKD